MKRCYIDNAPCSCGAYDVAGDCPRDNYVHDEDLLDEDLIEEAYTQLSNLHRSHHDEIERF